MFGVCSGIVLVSGYCVTCLDLLFSKPSRTDLYLDARFIIRGCHLLLIKSSRKCELLYRKTIGKSRENDSYNKYEI